MSATQKKKREKEMMSVPAPTLVRWRSAGGDVSLGYVMRDAVYEVRSPLIKAPSSAYTLQPFKAQVPLPPGTEGEVSVSNLTADLILPGELGADTLENLPAEGFLVELNASKALAQVLRLHTTEREVAPDQVVAEAVLPAYMLERVEPVDVQLRT